jgi:uncharacterized protein YeaO (DUF488 family)
VDCAAAHGHEAVIERVFPQLRISSRSMLRLKRAYEPRTRGDGHRVLVDRLWPRGVSKERLAIDEWMKDLAPTAELRRWFAHDPVKWLTFQRRYERELEAHDALVDILAKRALEGRVTLIFGAKDEAHNDAVVLAAVVRRRMAAILRSRRRAAHSH